MTLITLFFYWGACPLTDLYSCAFGTLKFEPLVAKSGICPRLCSISEVQEIYMGERPRRFLYDSQRSFLALPVYTKDLISLVGKTMGWSPGVVTSLVIILIRIFKNPGKIVQAGSQVTGSLRIPEDPRSLLSLQDCWKIIQSFGVR